MVIVTYDLYKVKLNQHAIIFKSTVVSFESLQNGCQDLRRVLMLLDCVS